MTRDMPGKAVPDAQEPQAGVPEGRGGSAGGSKAPVTYGCGGCDNRWQGVSRAHCAAKGCHRTFGGVGLFDRHQRLRGENRVCLDPETIVTESGARVMWFVNGLWVSAENPVGRKPPGRKVALDDA